MKPANLHINLVDSYFGLLRNLSPDSKLELITRLSESMKTTKKKKDVSLKSLFGAFDSEKSAETIIAEIRNSRVFNREIESL